MVRHGEAMSNADHLSASPPTPRALRRQRASRLAEEQRGVLARRQLVALGWSTSAIDRGLGDRLLRPVWPGVYGYGHCVLTPDGWLAAAALAAGADSALAARASAAARGLLRPWSRIDVISTGQRGLRLPGLRVHQVDLRPEERDVHRGLPVTTLARTALDVAAMEGMSRVSELLDEALLAEQYDHAEMRELLAARRGCRGIAQLRAAVELLGAQGTVFRSRPERAARDLLLGAGAAPPRVNAWFPTRAGHGYELDLWWPELMKNFEIDGPRHRLPNRQRLDALRDAELRRFGIEVTRFASELVTDCPERALYEMLTALDAA